jgi:hypothetical protein
VRGRGPLGFGRGWPPRRRGWLLLAAEPTLQGAFAGQLVWRVRVGQPHAEVASPPTGVLLTQCHSQRVEGVAWIGGLTGSGPVVGLEVVGLLPKASQQLAYGSWAKVERLRDGGGVVALAGSLQDKAAQGQREWCRHGDPRKNGPGLTIDYPPAAARQNLCVGINGKTYCRVTAPGSPSATFF